MAIRPDYNVGTLALVGGSADFTTSGASLQTAAVQAGDAIIAPSGHVLIIASITGQNSGTLFLPCPAGAAGSALPLRIRFQPDGSRYQGAVRNLIDLLSSGNIEAFAALVGAAGLVPIFTGVGTMDLADPATFGIQDPNGNLGELAALAGVDNLAELSGWTYDQITGAATAVSYGQQTLTSPQKTQARANIGALGLLEKAADSAKLDGKTIAQLWEAMGASWSFGANTSLVVIPCGTQKIAIQRGHFTSTIQGGGDDDIIFPVAFKDMNYSVSASANYANGPAEVYGIACWKQSRGVFRSMVRYAIATAAGGASNLPFTWIAIGEVA